ncbi:hypothetical protein QE250_00990 [Chromatiaceae bacterium AAb-1]|nr:hypothetical protein [Chromatiaceae bacterium AAb-1]
MKALVRPHGFIGAFAILGLALFEIWLILKPEPIKKYQQIGLLIL